MSEKELQLRTYKLLSIIIFVYYELLLRPPVSSSFVRGGGLSYIQTKHSFSRAGHFAKIGTYLNKSKFLIFQHQIEMNKILEYLSVEY
jgi:hypothetical protein